jgi:hypothetical protein
MNGLVKKMDIFYKGESYTLVPPEVRHSIPTSSKSLQFAYFMNITHYDANVAQWIPDLPSLHLTLMLVLFAAVILLLGIDACIKPASTSNEGTLFARIQLRVLYMFGHLINYSMDTSRLSLSIRLFSFLLLITNAFRLLNLLLCSSVQTNLVVLNLKDVSDDLQHMLDTRRELCYSPDELHMDLFRKGRPNSVFQRLWTASLANPCRLPKDNTFKHKLSAMSNKFFFESIDIM